MTTSAAHFPVVVSQPNGWPPITTTEVVPSGIRSWFTAQARRRRAHGASALRAAGRVVLWGLVAILLVRGVAGVIAEPQQGASGQAAERGADPATSAFAVRFARAYLSDPSSPALRPLFARGRQPGRGSRPTGAALEVAQAEVGRRPRPRRRAGGPHRRLRAPRRAHPLSGRPDRPLEGGRGGGAGRALDRRGAGAGRGRLLSGPGRSPARTRRRSATLVGEVPARLSRGERGVAISPTCWRPGRRSSRSAAALRAARAPGVSQLGDGEGARRDRRSPPPGCATRSAAPPTRSPTASRSCGGGRWYVAAVEGAVVMSRAPADRTPPGRARGLALLLAPPTALAAGNDVGRNIGSLLRHYAARALQRRSSRSSAWSS